MGYSVMQFKRLCLLAGDLSDRIPTLQENLERIESAVFHVRSTSIVKISKQKNGGSALNNNVLMYEEMERQLNAQIEIVELINEAVDQIDPSYRMWFYELYMLPGRKRRFPVNLAEEYGIERHDFTRRLNEAVAEALQKPKTQESLDKAIRICRAENKKDFLAVLHSDMEK